MSAFAVCSSSYFAEMYIYSFNVWDQIKTVAIN